MRLSKYGKKVVRNFLTGILVIALIITGVFVYKKINNKDGGDSKADVVSTLEDGFVNGLVLKQDSFIGITEEDRETVSTSLKSFVHGLQFSVLFVELSAEVDKGAMEFIASQVKELKLPLYVLDESNHMDAKDYKKYRVDGLAKRQGYEIQFGAYEAKLFGIKEVKDDLYPAHVYQSVLKGEMDAIVFEDYETLLGYELEVGLIASNLSLNLEVKDVKEETKTTQVGTDYDEYSGVFETIQSDSEFFSNAKHAQIGVSNKPVIKGARMVAALGSILSDPNNEEVIKSTAVKGSEFNVVGSVGTGDKMAYELSTGDFIMAKYTEEIPAVKPLELNGVEVISEDGYEVLKFKDTGSPLPYIFRSKDELVITFVGASFNGTLPEITEGIFVGLEINNRAGNMELRISLDDASTWGYLVDLSDNIIKVRVKETPTAIASYFQPLKDKVVVLDAGHGGTDPGSLNPKGGKSEAQINLELSNHIKTRLLSLGATVVETRQDDTFVSLWDRVNIFNDHNGDYFISVHHNASVNTGVHGVEMYYAQENFKALATGMSSDMSAITKRRDRGPYQWIQYVLRSSLGPSVLIEAGFMTEDNEFADIQNIDQQILSAGVVADQIVKDLSRRINRAN